MELSDFFAQHPKAALAFSGGADSAFVLYSAAACGADIMPYFVRSQFQPAFERADARRLAAALGVPLRELELDVLCEDAIAANPAERCYFCKRRIFGAICTAAAADGYPVVLDGTNASDDRGDRPGMRALEQAHVLSPLRLCGLTKAEVRRRSKAAGVYPKKPGCLPGISPPMPALPHVCRRASRSRLKSSGRWSGVRHFCSRSALRTCVCVCATGARCCSFRRRSTRRHGRGGRRSLQGCPNTFPPSDSIRKRGQSANENHVY